MSNAEIIGMLRLELTETLGRLGEVERLNQLLLESHRRVYLATKPVLDAVAHWCETEDNTEEGGSASATLFDAYQAYNPPREFEVYK